MVEIIGAEDAGYVHVGGWGESQSTPSHNNAEMERVYGIIGDISHGTLTPEFSKLYWAGGMFSPAYDMRGAKEVSEEPGPGPSIGSYFGPVNLLVSEAAGNYPPSATIEGAQKDLDLLAPVYRSLIWKGNVRGASMSLWVPQEQQQQGRRFAGNLEHFVTRLANEDVYALMRRHGYKRPLIRHYGTPRDFRRDYFRVIDGEGGDVLLATNDQEYALRSFRREEEAADFEKSRRGDYIGMPLVVEWMPGFVQRRWIGKSVAERYPGIEDTLDQ